MYISLFLLRKMQIEDNHFGCTAYADADAPFDCCEQEKASGGR